MRINVVLGPFVPPPPGPAGAVERVWMDLARAFGDRGHSVTVVHREDSKPADSRAGGVHTFSVPGFASTGRTAVNIPLDFVYTMRAARACPAADVTVSNTFSLPFLSRLFGRKLGALHVHVQRVPKGQARLYARLGTVRFAAVSSYIAECLIREHPSSAKHVRVFPNPIANDIFTPRERSPNGRPAIAFAGRIHPEKGLDLLIEALRILKQDGDDVEVRAAGPWQTERGGGGARYRESLLRAADGLAFTLDEPFYDRHELADFLRAADFFCYPSLALHGEASPVAPLEAMACGLPVILSNLPQYRDYYTAGIHGVTFDQSAGNAPRLLADAIQRVLKRSEDERREMAHACATRAREFSVEAVADLYLRDFAELMGEKT